MCRHCRTLYEELNGSRLSPGTRNENKVPFPLVGVPITEYPDDVCCHDNNRLYCHRCEENENDQTPIELYNTTIKSLEDCGLSQAQALKIERLSWQKREEITVEVVASTFDGLCEGEFPLRLRQRLMLHGKWIYPRLPIEVFHSSYAALKANGLNDEQIDILYDLDVDCGKLDTQTIARVLKAYCEKEFPKTIRDRLVLRGQYIFPTPIIDIAYMSVSQLQSMGLNYGQAHVMYGLRIADVPETQKWNYLKKCLGCMSNKYFSRELLQRLMFQGRPLSSSEPSDKHSTMEVQKPSQAEREKEKASLIEFIRSQFPVWNFLKVQSQSKDSANPAAKPTRDSFGSLEDIFSLPTVSHEEVSTNGVKRPSENMSASPPDLTESKSASSPDTTESKSASPPDPTESKSGFPLDSTEDKYDFPTYHTEEKHGTPPYLTEKKHRTPRYFIEKKHGSPPYPTEKKHGSPPNPRGNECGSPLSASIFNVEAKHASTPKQVTRYFWGKGSIRFKGRPP